MNGIERVAFPALGTTAVVCMTDPSALPDAVAVVKAQLHAVDLACSRFRDDSELTALNNAAGTPVPVSDTLWEALTVALRAAALTAGDVDPTIGNALRLLGYDRDFAEVADRAGVDSGYAVADDPRRPANGVVRIGRFGGYRDVTVDPARRTVLVPRGITLDLGATAKAWAADRCASLVSTNVHPGVLISLGGDIAVAGEGPEGGWIIQISDSHADGPDRPGRRYGRPEPDLVSITGGGLATSSTTVRQWIRASAQHHHIIDPATGRSAASVWKRVSVAAGSCADANIASTAAIVRGAAAPAWLRSVGLPAQLVATDGSTVRVGGWPSDDEHDDEHNCGPTGIRAS